jgi:hypothetical protein
MCWSAEVSILSFIIGITVSYTLLKRNKPYDKSLAILISFYSFIQLCEFLMWKSLEGETYGFNSPEELNLFATKMAYINLYSHAFAMGYGIYLETGQELPMKLGLIIFFIGLLSMPNITQISKPTPKSNGHLVWNFNNHFYVPISLFIIWCLFKYTKLEYTWIAILFYFGTYILSFTTQGEGSASYWCWISAFLSFYPLLY